MVNVTLKGDDCWLAVHRLCSARVFNISGILIVRQNIGILGLNLAMSNYNCFFLHFLVSNIHLFRNQLAFHAQTLWGFF